MTSKERVRAAFNHQEPDRVPVFEIHIDSKPASEILGHFAPVGYGGAVRGKLQNEMIIEGRSEEFQRMHMEGRLELAEQIVRDGGRGVVFGRNALQVRDPGAFQRALCDVVKKGTAAAQAAKDYGLRD